MNKYLKLVVLMLCFGMTVIGCNNSSKIEQQKDIKEPIKKTQVAESNGSVEGIKEVPQKVETKVTATISPIELENELLKSEVAKVHLQNIQYLLEGNAKKLVEVFSYKGYTEFNEEFIKQKPVLDEAYFKRVFACELYQRYGNKKLEEVINVKRKGGDVFDSTKHYEPDSHYEQYKSYITFKNRDVSVQFMAMQGCPIFMWYAFYRKENGEWKLIASNFWNSYYFDTMFKVK